MVQEAVAESGVVASGSQAIKDMTFLLLTAASLIAQHLPGDSIDQNRLPPEQYQKPRPHATVSPRRGGVEPERAPVSARAQGVALAGPLTAIEKARPQLWKPAARRYKGAEN